ncbi:MAG TPA: hypothetical protein VHY32_01555, partial [Caulobacteraceae bacterium]|nr:hypothetical protein [Caulobacteraceae bacterium]
MSGRPPRREEDDRAAQPARRARRRNRVLGGALSIAAHFSIALMLFLWVSPDMPKAPDPAAVIVSLVREPPPAAPEPPAPKPKPARAKASHAPMRRA